MKKKALLYVLIFPIIYLYGLAENHFHFGQTKRAYSLEFIYEYFNAWRVLFGKEYIDHSVKIANYNFKTKAKKANIDIDIALAMKELYSSWWISFYKEKRKLVYHWSGDYGDITLGVIQVDKDEFKIEYYNNHGYGKTKDLCTEYIFSKEETIDTLKTIKSID